VSILLVALLLLAVFAVPLFHARRFPGAGTDVFSPVRIVSVFHILTVVPFLLLAAWNLDAFHPLIRHHRSVPDIDVAVAWYGFVQAIAFCAILAGLSTTIGDKLSERLPVIATRFNDQRAAVAVIFSLALGLAAFAFILSQVGGFLFFVENVYNRSAMLEGLGYANTFLSLLVFPVLILVYRLRTRITLPGISAAAGAALVAIAILSSMGGRRPVIMLGVYMMIVWHYGVRPIKRFKLVAVAAATIMVPYMVLVPILRTPDGPRYYISHPDELLEATRKNLDLAVKHTSYVEFYVLATNYFSLDRLWAGRSYLDLLAAPIPSGFFSDKPPVDEGVYLRTIAGGGDVTPSMGRRALNRTSWPPETLGITYMNFWFPGVIIGMFLLGVLYRCGHQYMIRSQYSLFSIYVYCVVIFNFHFSNLRLVFFAMSILISTTFFVSFFGGGARAGKYVAPPVSSRVARGGA
jgi:hypothetical protein